MSGTAPVAEPSRGQTAGAAPSARCPSRLAAIVAATLGLPLLLLYVVPRAPQNGLVWDALMVAGLLAAAVIAALPLVSPRLWHRFGGRPAELRSVLYWHADLSYLAVTLALVHTIGVLILDPVAIEYLKLSAPWSMLAALLATVLLLVLLASSWYRIGLGIRYRSWRRWHVGISLVATALMVFHIIDAGYFINAPVKQFVFVVLLAGPSAMALLDGALARGHARAPRGASALPPPVTLELPASRAGSRRLAILVCGLLFIAVISVAIPRAGSRPADESRACLNERCE